MTEFFLELMSLLYHAACTGGMTSVCSFTGELYGWKTILERDHFHFYIKPCQCECHRKTEIAEEYRFVSYSINHLLDLHPGDLASDWTRFVFFHLLFLSVLGGFLLCITFLRQHLCFHAWMGLLNHFAVMLGWRTPEKILCALIHYLEVSK